MEIEYRAYSKKFEKMFYGREIELWGNPINCRVLGHNDVDQTNNKRIFDEYDVSAELHVCVINDGENKYYEKDVFKFNYSETSDIIFESVDVLVELTCENFVPKLNVIAMTGLTGPKASIRVKLPVEQFLFKSLPISNLKNKVGTIYDKEFNQLISEL